MTLTEFVYGRIPAVLVRSEEFVRSVAIGVPGFGLGLALDEWVLFVLHESVPDAPYMRTLSMAGALTLVGDGLRLHASGLALCNNAPPEFRDVDGIRLQWQPWDRIFQRSDSLLLLGCRRNSVNVTEFV